MLCKSGVPTFRLGNASWGIQARTSILKASNSSAAAAAAAAKSLQSCPTLCDTTDSSPPGSPVPGILQARTLEWGAISFSNAWKGKVKVKSLSRARLLATPWTAAYQAPLSMDFQGKSTGVGCHCLFRRRNARGTHIAILLKISTTLLIFSNVKSTSTVTQSYPILCDPMDCSLPRNSTSVQGILQARLLYWVAISFSNVKLLSKFREHLNCVKL